MDVPQAAGMAGQKAAGVEQERACTASRQGWFDFVRSTLARSEGWLAFMHEAKGSVPGSGVGLPVSLELNESSTKAGIP